MPPQTATDPQFGPLKRQMSKMMDQMSKGFYSFYPSETWTPNVNLYETDGSYLVCVDLAGVIKEEIDVQVVEGRLVLKGNRTVPVKPVKTHSSERPDKAGRGMQQGEEEEPPPRYRVHLMEIDHGQFSREVELPEDVHKDHINATYRNGMLWIELPKKT